MRLSKHSAFRPASHVARKVSPGHDTTSSALGPASEVLLFLALGARGLATPYHSFSSVVRRGRAMMGASPSFPCFSDGRMD
jgi:hypothetical protein